jgi:hypothetical protein
MDHDIDFIIDKEREALKFPPNTSDAVAVALKIEAHMVESSFYKVVDSDANEFKHIAVRLIQLTKEHIARLQDFVTNPSPA